MRVLGIDCGTQRTGWGVISSDGRTHRIFGHGVIVTSQRETLEQRLRTIAAGLRDAELSARSAVTSAQTAADYAARQAQRYDTLYKAGAVSSSDIETVVQQNAQTQAALADARARLVTAQKQLGYTLIRAPFAGVVADRDVSAGDVVQVGTLLYTVVDPSQLQLEAAVPAE